MTRRQLLTALFGAAVLALPVAGCGHQPVQEQQGAELILRYAENQPEDYPTTQAALAFADLVAQRTDGRVKVLVDRKSTRLNSSHKHRSRMPSSA